MQKGIIAAIVVALLCVFGLVVFCNSRETSPEIQKIVDVQYHKLSLRLVQLDEVTPKNYKLLSDQLDSIRWEPIEDGGKYEKAKKELFLEEKRKKAENIRNYYHEEKETIIPHIIEYPDDIKE